MNAKAPSQEPGPRPRIWDYRDARAYVRDVCAWEQEHGKGFSFRKLARFAELGAPNYVQAYISGRRNIKPATALKIAEGLGLDSHEGEFLALLVQLERADDPDERAGWYREVLQYAVRHSGTGVIDAARLAYFSHWFIPLVHAMASLEGFKPDPHWIAARTVPKIRAFDAKKALDTLTELGIFVFDDDGELTVCEPRLETEDGLRSIWGREYHKAMIGLSEQALDVWEPDERTTVALTVTVTEAQVGEVMAKVDQFRRELFHDLMTEQEAFDKVPGQVMQINFQAFKLTDIERSKS